MIHGSFFALRGLWRVHSLFDRLLARLNGGHRHFNIKWGIPYDRQKQGGGLSWYGSGEIGVKEVNLKGFTGMNEADREYIRRTMTILAVARERSATSRMAHKARLKAERDQIRRAVALEVETEIPALRERIAAIRAESGRIQRERWKPRLAELKDAHKDKMAVIEAEKLEGYARANAETGGGYGGYKQQGHR